MWTYAVDRERANICGIVLDGQAVIELLRCGLATMRNEVPYQHDKFGLDYIRIMASIRPADIIDRNIKGMCFLWDDIYSCQNSFQWVDPMTVVVTMNL